MGKMGGSFQAHKVKKYHWVSLTAGNGHPSLGLHLLLKNLKRPERKH